jgi:hypothetical protein
MAIGDTLVADVVAEVEIASADEIAASEALEAPAPRDDSAISAKEVEDVLTMFGGTSTPALLGAQVQRLQHSRWWSVAVAAAVVALGIQGINHFRGVLAGHATIGPWVQQAYNLLGITVTPHWDVRQYEILEWVATAEPNSRGLGSLKITAHIKNNGPQRQPYPGVKLRLKDRWEKAVGSRVFAPAEYLPRDTPRGGLMAAGETTSAEIEVVDPGPDAYGFELDICIEVEANALSCGTDKVFL